MTHKHSADLPTPGEFLRRLSSQDFLDFGLQQIAYIRPILVDDKRAFALHAADGTPLQIMESMGSAIGLARHNDLEPVTVH
ncbi:MAG: DUF1150 domain-containing protein [Alphaproteobacteria bacterium]|nr:DUF1150 domain-containing protein [Alphaproteobacteria bacterium]